MLRKICAGAIAALAISGSAQAATVVNAGFEDGSTGWTLQTDAHVGAYTELAAYGAYGFDKVSSLNAAWFAPNVGNGLIRQAISTVAGQLYAVEFDLAVIGTGIQYLGISASGVDLGIKNTYLLASANNNLATSFEREMFVFRAAGDEVVLSFIQAGVGGGSALAVIDNVAVSIPAHVPEPSTWAMLIVGFGFIGGMLRRYRAPAIVPS